MGQKGVGQGAFGRTAVRRAAVVAALAVILGTAGILAVTGTREPADALKLLSGQAWLGNSKVGTASQVDGYSGKTTGQVGVGKPGDPFEVIQRPDGAYILDLRTGVLTRVSDSTLTAGASRQLGGNASGLQVIADNGQTWVLDHNSGVLQQVNPTTLAAQGPADPLGASTGTAVVDSNGNLWVPVPSTGQVIEVSTNGNNLAHKVGAPGDQVQLAVTSSGVWAVDGQAGQAQSLTGPATLSIPQTSAATPPVVSSSTTSPYLPVLEGDQLLDINTSQPSQSSTTSPSYRGTSQIALVGNEAYLLNPNSTNLQTVNLAPLMQNPAVTVPPGSDQLVPQDGMLFVNNPNSQQAVVVSPNGTTTPVNKYDPTSNQSSAGDNNASDVPTQSPQPAQTPVDQTPVGDQQGPSGPNGGGSGNGSQYTQPPSSYQPPPTQPTTQPTTPPVTPPQQQTTTTTKPNPEAPGQPTLQSPLSVSGPSLTASWTAPANAGYPAFTSYKLTVTVQSGSGKAPSPVTVSGTTTTDTVSGLSGGTTYCVQVQAVNSNGAGSLSNSVCGTTTKDVSDAPGAPTATLGSVASSKQSVALSWTAPASLGPFNTAIKEYDISAKPSSGTAVSATSTSTSTTVSLALGTTYSITVLAANQSGNASSASGAKSVTTYGVPSTVGRPTVKTDGAGVLDVSWSAASANDGQSVSYTVSDGSTTTPAQKGTSYSFTGLSNQAYNITVTATDQAGSAPASPAASATPWSRDATGYLCQSVSWTYYEIDRRSDCGNQPGYSQINSISSTPDEFVSLSQQPAGSETLYTGVIGNSPFTTDSAYYALSASAPAPAGWSYGASTGLSAEFTVFSSSQGTGSVEWCVGYDSSSSQHPYWMIYHVGSAPGGCKGSTFWS